MWALFTLASAASAFAHPRDSRRIEALENDHTQHIQLDAHNGMKATWEHGWSAIVERVRSLEAKYSALSKEIATINRTIFLATGALMAFQFILASKPAFLFKGGK